MGEDLGARQRDVHVRDRDLSEAGDRGWRYRIWRAAALVTATLVALFLLGWAIQAVVDLEEDEVTTTVENR